MKTKRVLWVALYVLLIALPCFLYWKDARANGILPAMTASGLLGLAAYSLFALEFLLASRPKFVDRVFSLDRLYRFHMFMAVAAVLLAFAHKLIKDAYYQASLNKTLGNLALLVFALVAAFSAFWMTDRLFFRAALAARFRKFLRKLADGRYQSKVLLHNVVVLCMVTVLVHVLLAYSVKADLPLMLALLAYFAVPALFYLHHKIWKRYFDAGKRYVVADVIEECGSVSTVRFKPASGKPVFRYLPGQFLYVRVKSPAVPGDEHPFSIASSPERQDSVCITAKKLGDFTKALPKLKPGDAAVIDGAFGSFSYLKLPHADKLCFLAGGIGITPFLSMLRYIAERDPEREVVLLWGVRDMNEMICGAEMEKYAKELKHFRFVPVVSHDKSYEGERGFINAERIGKYVENLQEFDFFICGPGPMLDMQLKNLRELGINKKRVHFERFAM